MRRANGNGKGSRNGNGAGHLIAALQEIQDRDNYLSERAMRDVSARLSIPFIDVYSVATFFRAFSLKPRGKHVCTVCIGTACHVRGSERILRRLEERLDVPAGETTRDGRFTLETVNCLGCCALGPVVKIDKAYTGNPRADELNELVASAEPGRSRP
jgi:NADH-quinone oxidoreductase subunit E